MRYKLAIVGEAWGEEEERQKLPFVGTAGWCLDKMLEEVNIRRVDCFLTNVFNLRPKPTNDIDNLCTSKTGVTHNLPPLRIGNYIRDEYLPELDRLYAELTDASPNLILACGGTATWALVGAVPVSRVRGAVTISPTLAGRKVLPTYHPAAILRDWSLRHVTIMDLIKAKRESEFPELRRPFRKLYIRPTLEDIRQFFHTHVLPAKRCAVDIETDPANGQITCIGFAPTPALAIVIPFCRGKTIASGSYWETVEAEIEACNLVRQYLRSPCEKVFQNGIYDITWLWRKLSMSVNNFAHDTMILHHALYPESKKSLDFLGAAYTNEAAWKLAKRSWKKGDTE